MECYGRLHRRGDVRIGLEEYFGVSGIYKGGQWAFLTKTMQYEKVEKL